MATPRDYEQIAETNAQQALTEAKEALKEDNLTAYAEKMTALSTAVDKWNAELQNVAFKELATHENPMIAAVKQFYIDAYKIKEEKDKESGKIVDIKLDKRARRIDLEAFCEDAKINTAWVNDTSKLRDLLEARETAVYEMNPAQLAKKSYYFISVMRKKEEGETPDSKTQIVRLLQTIIDEAIFVDDGNGKNVYKCTNHDLAFIQDAVTKFDPKKKCSIAMMNDRAFKTVMMSVFAHCLGENITVVSGAKKQKGNT